MLLTSYVVIREYAVVVSFSGEIDMAVSEAFRSDLMKALDAASAIQPTPLLIVNLHAVSFLSSSGFSELLRVQREAVSRGLVLGLITSHTVQRLMKRIRLDEVLRPFSTLEDAVSVLTGLAS
ncbi:STAS domain-containing protein [Mycobacterium paraterrae]|uniref:STAS domain-containing protein n=1 Tax=Mycobacterium paraterrae TaxID=577492 RepID=A0ABY3VRV6_9MYCO|nr:STAS domain-containing protein [Mycobacterium paraterrae]UMB71139.1 STAS domain-containing protein [Mycobacterium paraterrae]